MERIIDLLLAQRTPPDRLRAIKARLRRSLQPIWFGNLRRTRPFSRNYGYDRGGPIDRYYIEKFLDQYRQDIRGRVVEIKDSGYTRQFGSSVTTSDVLDVDPANPAATLVADLAAADHIPPAQFDCFILTQVLQFIYDFRGAACHAHRLLKPGGVMLVTLPVTSRIAPEWGPDGEFWRFTPAACRHLFGEIFGPDQVSIHVYGNLLSSIAFLAGAAAQELRPHELDEVDAHFPVLVGVRAFRSLDGSATHD